MYHINPLTEEEINMASLLEEGIYNFEVTKHERTTSKTSGNPMAKLTIDVIDANGKRHFVYDYLVFSDKPFCIRKIKHFCDSVGLDKEYKSGKIPEELVRRCGKVHIGVVDNEPKPGGGFYPAKNTVIDYVMTDLGATKYEAPLADPRLNDDIPF